MSSRVYQERARMAQTLSIRGATLKEIAQDMNCSTRTVSRYLGHDLEDPVDLVSVDPSLRDRFLSRAEPLMLSLLDDLEGMRERGELKGRDLILASGLLFDKIARLSPSTEKEGEEGLKVITINMSSPQLVEQEVQKRLKELEVVEGGEVVEEGQTTDNTEEQ